MPTGLSRPVRRRAILLAATAATLLTAAACSGGSTPGRPSSGDRSAPSLSTAPGTRSAAPNPTPTRPPTPTPTRPPGEFTISFAGDVHFADRVGVRLARDPATVFGEAAAQLRGADLTMVNLETAITTGGEPQAKAFTFRAPPSAFAALKDAGVDVATMANNHGADFGASGLRDTLAAIRSTGFPVVGIGRNAAAAYAPYETTLNGTKVAIIGADQVQDETTLRLFSAGASTPGVADAFSPQLLQSVRAARARGFLVVVYLHWGTEYRTCPNDNQTALADQLAAAGATAVIGTHAHVLQGAGWRADGTYVAYGLGNYLWWMSFGNEQDDNGVLTLTFRDGRVVADRFVPSHLDDRGVPLPAHGAERQRILAEWSRDRTCTTLSATPPAR